MQEIGVTDLVGSKHSGGPSLLRRGKRKKSKAGNPNSEVKDRDFLSVWKFEKILFAAESV